MQQAIPSAVQKLQNREERIGIKQTLLGWVLGTESEVGFQKHNIQLTASLKTLYSDFIVRELSPLYGNGEPLRLEPATEPVSSVGSASSAVIGEKHDRAGNNSSPAASHLAPAEGMLCDARLAEQVRATLSPLIDEADLAALLAGLGAGERKILLPSVTDKAKRTELHKAIKACLSATHVSSTENGVVAVVKATAADRREEKRRSNPIKTRKFLHFTLYKENLDSNQVFRLLAKHFNMSTRQFQFSGTKDKRAVTLQRVAIRDMDPKKLLQINERSFGPQGVVRVCSLTEHDTGLRLGDACGNHFSIALRLYPTSPKPAPSELAAIEKALATVGAINYFGPQRYGTTAILTSDVGIQLLQGSYEAAFKLLMRSKGYIVPDLAAAVDFVQNGDYTAALEKVPYFCFQERDMIGHLVRHPNDFQGLFQTLPRTLAMLYFHSVQSLLWNLAASARLSGPERLSAEVGDLVLETVYQVRCGTTTGDDETTFATAAPSTSEDGPLPTVRQLSENDPLDRFTLGDVVLPIPGPDPELCYPSSKGCAFADYIAAAEALGVREGLLGSIGGGVGQQEGTESICDKLAKVFHYHGAYRPLCMRPNHVRLSLRSAPTPRAPVLETDLQLLEGDAAKAKRARCGNDEENTAKAAAIEVAAPVDVVVAEFSLPPGCYATCVLREFCYVCGEDYHATPSAAAPEEATQEVAEGSE